MESSHKAGIVKPSEWILLMFATVLLGAAVSSQRATVHDAAVPVEAKIDIQIDESLPVIIDSKAAFEMEAGSETQVAAVMLPSDTPEIVQKVLPVVAGDGVDRETAGKSRE